MSPRPFGFGDDFRGPPRDEGLERALAVQQAVAEAEAEAFRQGVAQGRREAEADGSRRLLAAVELIAAGVPGALGQVDARAAGTEEDALAFFRSLAHALAGRALEAQPLAPIADAAAEAFRHLRGVPHLAVRVAPDLVEAVEELLRGMARERGFEGRLIVLGATEIAPGDARLEWAEGGVVRDRAAIEAAIASILPTSGPASAPAAESEPAWPDPSFA